MKASDIRLRFLDYFQLRGHELVPSGPLVPPDDPTLLFTNAGMVQFKRVFLGEEKRPYRRAVTAQKCVRAGGKHNDLEQVGKTARHHTFFEMLGNFSFGDYFKRDAIHFAWEFMTGELALDPDRFHATVHHTDDEAAVLWQEVSGLDPGRVHRLGDKDNFWQMGDTGPCGPCSELHYDLRPEAERSESLSTEQLEALGEEGRILELWNLVFMQFDRDEEGNLAPLPAPSIDTGAGLERIAAVLQGVDSNYHTDLFMPLLDQVAQVVGAPYQPHEPEGVGYRVLADHARAVAFLLSDGVFPSNEGRGYVLRRILRRSVRHAWLLDRREPTLVEIVAKVVEVMSPTYPELRDREDHLLRTTRAEEERFLQTIEGGMDRFDELAPPRSRKEPVPETRMIPGAEVFRLYDTFGFPQDLTRIMAEERGYAVDLEGFERELQAQRERSREDRAQSVATEGEEFNVEGWQQLAGEEQRFVGYGDTGLETEVVAIRRENGRLGLILRENPFYLESGGQVSDRGVVSGDGWSVSVDQVVRVGRQTAVLGEAEGDAPGGTVGPPLQVRAQVDPALRHDTERNHTATHLLHAALREVLGDHVVQRGSLVAPDRLRFDFTHSGPLTPEELEEVEDWVNQAIWKDVPVRFRWSTYDEAVADGAIALFGEKYGDEVRVVEIPGLSVELCGGTHLRRTGEAGLFLIVKEGGVAGGVRRIEAVTGPGAYRHVRDVRERIQEASAALKTPPDNLVKRIHQLRDEREELERHLEEVRRTGGSAEELVHEATVSLASGDAVRYRAYRIRARDADEVRSFGDHFLESETGGVAVVSAELPEGKRSLFAFVTDDVIGKGIGADHLVRGVAEVVGGRGGGRPHMAQAGVEDAGRMGEALVAGEEVLTRLAREAK